MSYNQSCPRWNRQKFYGWLHRTSNKIPFVGSQVLFGVLLVSTLAQDVSVAGRLANKLKEVTEGAASRHSNTISIEKTSMNIPTTFTTTHVKYKANSPENLVKFMEQIKKIDSKKTQKVDSKKTDQEQVQLQAEPITETIADHQFAAPDFHDPYALANLIGILMLTVVVVAVAAWYISRKRVPMRAFVFICLQVAGIYGGDNSN
eukprot:jgi/Bigna1/85615/estExt_fgenesh1_pg.C_50058